MRTVLSCYIAFIAAFAVLYPVLPAQAQSTRVETIAAVVNDDAISETDVEDRMQLIITSSGMPNTDEIRAKMKPQIMTVLIEEKLRIQEAKRLDIEVTDQDIAQGFAALAGQNKMSPEQFHAVLNQAHVSTKSLEDQIRAQIAWSRVVQSKLRPQISIADNEVDAVLNRLRNSIGKTEYRVSEIFLPVENPSAENDVKQLANKLTRQMAEGHVPFERLAAQFSQAAGASKGGDMGWVQQDQLDDQLADALSKMNKNEISKPIRTLAGYHILYLRAERKISEETLPSRDEVMQHLGFERLDRKQRSYLMDLKAKAFIDQRV